MVQYSLYDETILIRHHKIGYKIRVISLKTFRDRILSKKLNIDFKQKVIIIYYRYLQLLQNTVRD